MKRTKKNYNESRVNVRHGKILWFKSEDFFHSCGPILHLLTFQRSHKCVAPKLSRSPSKAWSTQISKQPNKTSLVRFSTFYINLSTLCAQLLGKSVFWLYHYFYAFSNSKPYKPECLLDLIVFRWYVQYLCNEGECGLKWLTPYIKVCIIIRQLHYFIT